MEREVLDQKYNSRVHAIGIITSLILIVSLLIIPIVAAAIFGQKITWGPTLQACASALMVFGPVALIEFLSYVPIIGAGGQYLSFVTGNVMNMKLPAATSGRKIAGVEAGTDEGDCISIVSIAISSITTTVILFIGMLLAAQLLPLLNNEFLAPAFANVMPAIMGALGLPVIVRDFRNSCVPTIVSIILTISLSYANFMAKQGPMMILFLALSLGWSYFLYRKGKAQKAAEEAKAAA